MPAKHANGSYAAAVTTLEPVCLLDVGQQPTTETPPLQRPNHLRADPRPVLRGATSTKAISSLSEPMAGTFA